MLLTLDLPDREQTLATLRARWRAATESSFFSGMEGRFESNAFGEVIVSPPPAGAHSLRGFKIAVQLYTRLGGEAMQECPVLTTGGVKLADAAWYSSQRFETVRGQAAFETAPEICVEVMSPSNTDAEMRHKRQLYFDAGAKECWVCDLEGRMTYCHADSPDTAREDSSLCPDFPNASNP